MMYKYEVKAIHSGQVLKKLEDVKFEEDKLDFQKLQKEDLSLQKYWDMAAQEYKKACFNRRK